MLTSATVQGGQGGRAGLWLKNAADKIGPAPWFPTWPLTQRASWSGAGLEPSAAGYELAGHDGLEQRGTALDRLKNVAVEIIGLSQRRANPLAGARGAARPRAGGAGGNGAMGAGGRRRPLGDPLLRASRPVNDCRGFAAALRAVVDRPRRSEILHPRDRRLGSSHRPALRPRFPLPERQFPPSTTRSPYEPGHDLWFWSRFERVPAGARRLELSCRPFAKAKGLDRGRDAHYCAPPAQIRTCGFPAYGSHLGCLTAKRALGQG